MPKRKTDVYQFRSVATGTDMIGTLFYVGNDEVEYYSVGSTSGPVNPAFENKGPIGPGTELKLAYNYDTEEYRAESGWNCTVVRVNEKSVTVRSEETGDPHRIFV